ncbi:MAG: transglutaminase-like domain-containing protein [Candidatus Asgardarchaeia archaeon]
MIKVKENKVSRYILFLDPIFNITYEHKIPPTPENFEYIIQMNFNSKMLQGRYKILISHGKKLWKTIKEFDFLDGEPLFRNFKLKYSIEVKNPNDNKEIYDLKVLLSIPLLIPGFQKFGKIKPNFKDVKITEDAFNGNKWLVKHFRKIAPKSIVKLEYETIVSVKGTAYQIQDISKEEIIHKSERYKKYILPERHIESNATAIKSIAKLIWDKSTSPTDFIKNAKEWIKTNIKYRPQEKELGALYAVNNRVGDCTEYAAVFVALCRAVNIPARLVGGFLKSRKWNRHAWAEVYIKNRWIQVDPSSKKKEFIPNITPNRIAMVRGNWMNSRLANETFATFRIPKNAHRPIFKIKWEINEI